MEPALPTTSIPRIPTRSILDAAPTPVALSRPIQGTASVRGLAVYLAAGLSVAAAALHLILAPDHAEHAPAHALTFIALAVLQLTWAALFLWRPQRWTLLAGLVLQVGSIALWGVTRVLRAPFTGHVEDVDVGGLATKGVELLDVVVLLAIAADWPRALPSSPRLRGFLPTILAIFVALGGAGAAYGLGLAAEPLFPGLTVVDHDHEESDGHDEETADGDESTGHEGHSDPSDSPADGLAVFHARFA